MKVIALVGIPLLCLCSISLTAKAEIVVNKGGIDGFSVQKPYITRPHISGPSVKVGINGVKVEKSHIEKPGIHKAKVRKPHISTPSMTIKP
ncbi:hypothetical protein [Yersinia aldovae]|uniref:hypothetical protein n=1 Tax=Yersinia aldovae TaxID=29483 RepID=UPI0005E98806|nr:hypothetical protein [Yersinia aldovae]CNK18328.1 Uncharacterised protein [Yersinia aldovae]